MRIIEKRHMIKESCTRCGGSGNTGHRRCNGVCFRCGGNGYTVTEAIFSTVAVEDMSKPQEPTKGDAERVRQIIAQAGDEEGAWLTALFNA